MRNIWLRERLMILSVLTWSSEWIFSLNSDFKFQIGTFFVHNYEGKIEFWGKKSQINFFNVAIIVFLNDSYMKNHLAARRRVVVTESDSWQFEKTVCLFVAFQEVFVIFWLIHTLWFKGVPCCLIHPYHCWVGVFIPNQRNRLNTNPVQYLCVNEKTGCSLT